MSQFEEYVERITRDLDLSREMVERVKREAADHLEDEKAALVMSGLSAQEAETEALRRFGDEIAVADLVARSLEAASRKHRRTRAGRRLCLLIGLPCVVLAMGAAWAGFIDEIDGAGYLPFRLYLSTSFLSLIGIGTLIAGRLTRCRPLAIALAALIVVAAFFLAPVSFHYSPLAAAFGQITPGMSKLDIAEGRFVMWLYLCWVPTALVGTAAVALRRDRLNFYTVIACFGAGFLSAALGWAGIALDYNWLRPFKWPKFVGVGLWFIVGLALVSVLARAFDQRLPRRKPRPVPTSSPSRPSVNAK